MYVCVSIVVSDVLEWEGEENFDDSARVYACTVSLDVIAMLFFLGLHVGARLKFTLVC